MQPQNEPEESQEAPRIDAGQPVAAAPSVDEPSSSGDCRASGDLPSERPAIFRLDYDRELTYLEHEGKLRGGRRPIGFKR